MHSWSLTACNGPIKPEILKGQFKRSLKFISFHGISTYCQILQYKFASRLLKFVIYFTYSLIIQLILPVRLFYFGVQAICCTSACVKIMFNTLIKWIKNMFIFIIYDSANYLLDSSINCFVYEMSEIMKNVRVYSRSPKWRLQMSCFDQPTVYCDIKQREAEITQRREAEIRECVAFLLEE